jgi:hypothetical protein
MVSFMLFLVIVVPVLAGSMLARQPIGRYGLK